MSHSHHVQHARLPQARELERADGGGAQPLRVLFAAASPLLTEVDARPIAGDGGTVTLYLSASPGAARFLVAVVSPDGEMIAGVAAETPAEALDAYRHPFARPDVPDIFGRCAA